MAVSFFSPRLRQGGRRCSETRFDGRRAVLAGSLSPSLRAHSRLDAGPGRGRSGLGGGSTRLFDGLAEAVQAVFLAPGLAVFRQRTRLTAFMLPTTSPFWLRTSTKEWSTPRSGLVRDRLVWVTETRMDSSSPAPDRPAPAQFVHPWRAQAGVVGQVVIDKQAHHQAGACASRWR